MILISDAARESTLTIALLVGALVLC